MSIRSYNIVAADFGRGGGADEFLIDGDFHDSEFIKELYALINKSP